MWEIITVMIADSNKIEQIGQLRPGDVGGMARYGCVRNRFAARGTYSIVNVGRSHSGTLF